jgi:hypothetical protein
MVRCLHCSRKMSSEYESQICMYCAHELRRPFHQWNLSTRTLPAFFRWFHRSEESDAYGPEPLRDLSADISHLPQETLGKR